MTNPFKAAFPSMQLPENRGGKRAIIVFGVTERSNPLVVLATCIDSDGTPHFNVPFTREELQAARPCVLVEDPNARAPSVGGSSGLIGPQGQRL